jgi:hypothetical protein
VIKLNNNTSYYLVHEAHPAIALILANKDLLGANFDENKKVDSEYYKVEMTTMASCCNVLRNKVLANMPISDLGKFSFEVRRLGTRDWLDLQVLLKKYRMFFFSQYHHVIPFFFCRTEKMPSPPSVLHWALLQMRSRGSRQSISRTFARQGARTTPGSRSPLRCSLDVHRRGERERERFFFWEVGERDFSFGK